MVVLDYYVSTGYALELLAQSPYHRQYPIGNYFRTEILPALWVNQARFYQTEAAVPVALVTWAWLNEEVEKDVHSTGRALQQHEWNCGDRLFFNDGLAPYNNIREILHDMRHNIFPDQDVATSLRRRKDGSVLKVNRWSRANQRRGVVGAIE